MVVTCSVTPSLHLPFQLVPAEHSLCAGSGPGTRETAANQTAQVLLARAYVLEMCAERP